MSGDWTPPSSASECPSVCVVSLGIKPPSGSHRYVQGLLDGLSRLSGGSTPRWAVLRSLGNRLVDRLAMVSMALLGYPGPKVLAQTCGVSPKVVHFAEAVSVPKGGKPPVVVTIHDMAAFLKPRLVSTRIAALNCASWLHRNTWGGVIVPSQSTADEVRRAGFPVERIWVIPHGVQACFCADPSSSLKKWAIDVTDGQPYLLHVAPPGWKKGTDILMQSWAKAVRRLPRRDCLLVWVTRSASTEKWLGYAGAASSAVRVLKGLRDDQLVALYSQARGVLVPSRWEGFSFPVSEGLAQGVPVVASDIPAHRERMEQGVYLYAVDSTDALAELIAAALRGELRASRVIPRGWPDVARDHLAVYRTVAAG
jgi:glycosyltransferase involved in cell wall biosynthesis